jgi:predicted PurR-regulated permease PerM
MDLDIAFKIAGFTAVIAFILLIVYTIFMISNFIKSLHKFNINFIKVSKDVSESINEIKRDFTDIKSKIDISLEQFNQTAEQISITAKTIDTGTRGITDTIKIYSDLFSNLHSKIVRPLNEAAVYVSATAKAFTTFTKLLTKSKE